MTIDIDIGAGGDFEAELRRVFWGRSNKNVSSRAYDVTTAAALPPDDMEAFIIADTDLGNPDEIAIWNDDESEFIFIGPSEGLTDGWEAFVEDEGIWVRYDTGAGAWVTGRALGPATSTNNGIALFDGTSGGLLKNSAVTISTDGTLASNSDSKVSSEKAVKTYADLRIPLTYIDTDTSLAANSDSKIASQKATKAYVDAAIGGVSGAMHFEGVIDCSANPNYPAADAGDVYRVSVAGKIGGGSGPNVEVNDILTCISTTIAGTHAGVGANWVITQGNLDGAVINTRQILGANGIQNGGDLTADRTLSLTTNARTRGFEIILDGGGSAITTGIKGDVQLPYGGTITKATLLADQSGSIVVNIWKDTYANFPPDVSDKITASAPPTISSATKSVDSTLTGWTTSVTAGDIFRINVDSCSVITRCSVIIEVLQT